MRTFCRCTFFFGPAPPEETVRIGYLALESVQIERLCRSTVQLDPIRNMPQRGVPVNRSAGRERMKHGKCRPQPNTWMGFQKLQSVPHARGVRVRFEGRKSRLQLSDQTKRCHAGWHPTPMSSVLLNCCHIEQYAIEGVATRLLSITARKPFRSIVRMPKTKRLPLAQSRKTFMAAGMWQLWGITGKISPTTKGPARVPRAAVVLLPTTQANCRMARVRPTFQGGATFLHPAVEPTGVSSGSNPDDGPEAETVGRETAHSVGGPTLQFAVPTPSAVSNKKTGIEASELKI